MNTEADIFLSLFGLKPQSCENCAHALPSAAYPMVYCPVKFKPVNLYDRCSAHVAKGKA